ncbi:toprim domain-containing protein [Weissella muntiaci]|nr:toprim domain-containing protein [Weissella muntiaci]
MAINREAMKAIPIKAYLDHKAIGYEPHGRNTIHLTEKNGHGLVVNLEKNTFQWYSSPAGDVYGDLGDFIENWFEMDKKSAWKEWAAFSRAYGSMDESTKADYTAPVSKKEDFDFGRWRTAKTTTNTEDYLINVRGFHPKFVEPLLKSGVIKQGTPRKDKETGEWMKPAILFPWINEDSKVVGLDVQGTDVDFEKFGKRGTEKRIGYSSDTNYGFNLKFGNGTDNLIVFEAPIDALSYTQQNLGTLRHENTTVLSLSGLNTNKVLNQLNIMTQARNNSLPEKLIIATDNDLAGMNFANEIYTGYSWHEHMEVVRQIPVEGKDWNDQLKAGVKGIEQFSLEENKKRYDTLYKLRDLDSSFIPSRGDNVVGARAKQKPLKDVNSVGSSSATNKTTTNKEDRALENRTRNVAIISNAMKNVQASQKDSAKVRELLDFVAQGQKFSPSNSWAIYGQRPNATIVMGYEQFQNEGIQVLHEQAKGKGIKTFGAPKNIKTIVTPDGEIVRWNQATEQQRKDANAGILNTKESKFYPIQNVFDISQTNATTEDLKRLLPQRPIDLHIDNSPQHLANAYGVLKQYVEKQGYRVVDNDAQANTFLDNNASHSPNEVYGGAFSHKGAIYTDSKHPENNTIILRPDMSNLDKVQTLAYEVGKVSLYQNSNDAAVDKDSHLREAKANLTSYVVLKNLGLDPEELSQVNSNGSAEGQEGKKGSLTDAFMNLADSDKSAELMEVTHAGSEVTRFLSDRLANGEVIHYEALSSKTVKSNNATKLQEQVIQDQSQEAVRTR